MADLNPKQFRQPALPGMGRMRHETLSEGTYRRITGDANAGASLSTAWAKENARTSPATTGVWSGPAPGQQVLNVGGQAPARQALQQEVGPHGFVQMPATSDLHAVYDSWGGKHGKPLHEAFKDFGSTPSELGWSGESVDRIERRGRQVRKMWGALPTVQVNSDTPVHTGQQPTETWGGPLSKSPSDYTGSKRDYVDEVPGAKVGKIRESLQSGESLKKPAWLIKQGNRLLAVDAHHRMLAARSEGLSSYPAKVWDWDKDPPHSQFSVGGGNAKSYWRQ